MEEKFKTQDVLVPPPKANSSPQGVWEASGDGHWILKEFTDLQIEENTEEGQDVEGGSAELNSYYAVTAVAIKAQTFPFLRFPL